MKLNYAVDSHPRLKKSLVFAFQQIIAIMAATILVPILVSSVNPTMKCDPCAALFGAGIGTLVYIFFTKRKSPVFLGSSFTFLGVLQAVAAQNYGYWGLIIGVAFAGIIYVIIALIIKKVGTKWIKKILPHVIIGPVLAIIGLSLSSTAGSWSMTNGGADYNLWYILIALVTFTAIVVASVKGGKGIRLIPFIVGIGVGLGFSLILSAIGYLTDYEVLKSIVDFKGFANTFSGKESAIQLFIDFPKFTFINAIKDDVPRALDGAAIANLALLFCPIAVVELAQHISDHENLSSIIEHDLLEDPGLDNTLLGDGVGSIVGAVFGGCANTTYGESIACVAISKNASVSTITLAAIGCMIISFLTPFSALLGMIPKCVMGGACIAMYGFISVSGLQMLKDVDLSDNRNLYPVAAILVIGIGGFVLNFGLSDTINPSTGTNFPIVQITSLAFAFIFGIIINTITHSGKDKEKEDHSDDYLNFEE